MLLETKKEGKYLVAYPLGRLDLTASVQVEEELSKLIDAGNHNIILNLKNVDYMSSSGFRTCISILRKLNVLGGTFKICEIQPEVNRIFEVIELNSLFDVFSNEKEASS